MRAVIAVVVITAGLGVATACGGSGGTSTSGGASSTSASSTSGAPGPATSTASCTIFPADNPWNEDISGLPVDAALMASVMPGMSLGTGLHPDWGKASDHYGIPITVGPASAPVPLTWTAKWGPTESDADPCPSGGGMFCYPIPLTAAIEGGPSASPGSDRHVLFLATDGAPDHCVLYELYNTQNQSGPGFTAANGAIWHLDTNALRPEGWTSADAAGLPIMPGLVRVAEVRSGAITHAIRMTMNKSRQAYIHPATHAAGTAAASLPPMGLRLRLKAGFDASSLPAPAKVVASALQRYGVMLADNGSDWYIGGESSDDWADLMSDLVSGLSTIKGSDFEIVKTGDVVIAAP